MAKSRGTMRGAVTGAVLSLMAGCGLTYSGQSGRGGTSGESRRSESLASRIDVNELMVAVFVVPLATIFGRWIDRALTPKNKEDR